MKEELKKTYRGFLGWMRYVRDYKDNVDNDLVSEHRLLEANKEIEKLKRQISVDEALLNTNKELIALRERRIEELTGKYGMLKKSIKEDLKEKEDMQKLINELADRLEVKESQRRINAIKIGHKSRKIKTLETEIFNLKTKIQMQEQKINFLKSCKHAPTKEEIEAYDLQMKEVEKRNKEK